MVVVVVVGRMQLVHSTGQSVLVTPPNSGCTHWDTATAPQKSRSGDPLQMAVVVVAVDVTDVVVEVVVVLPVVVVVVTTHVPQRALHLPRKMVPMFPAAAQYFE